LLENGHWVLNKNSRIPGSDIGMFIDDINRECRIKIPEEITMKIFEKMIVSSLVLSVSTVSISKL
jgi:hypothetical protein